MLHLLTREYKADTAAEFSGMQPVLIFESN